MEVEQSFVAQSDGAYPRPEGRAIAPAQRITSADGDRERTFITSQNQYLLPILSHMNSEPKSTFTTDNRAVAPVIGFILLFAIGIVAFSSYQAFVVPQQNSAVEFDHSQNVQSDLVDVRNTIVNAQRSEVVQSTRVRLGVNYPPRLIALNPSPASGSLQTDQPEQGITFENADLVDGDFEYFNGTSISKEEVENRTLNQEHDTRFLVYQPQYNEFRNGPTTIYEHSLLYNQFDQVDLGVTDQRLVEGDALNLVLIQGDFSQQGVSSISIDPRQLSGPTEDITIQSDGDPIELTIPTRTLSQTNDEEIWEESLESESVVDYERGPDDETITLTLDDDIGEYTLRVATIGFSGDESSDEFNIVQEDDEPTDPEPADPTFDTLEAEAGGGNIQNVDVTFEISEEADVEIEITPGDTDRFPNITPNQEQTENVDVTGNTNPVDVAVSLFDSDTGEQIVRCEGTLDGNNDFLTIDPGPGDSEFNCE